MLLKFRRLKRHHQNRLKFKMPKLCDLLFMLAYIFLEMNPTPDTASSKCFRLHSKEI